jgi:small subunit ribosomal protein S20
LANIKSQIKRNRQNEKRRLNNRNVRGAARTAVNQARAAFDEGAPETKDAILKAISVLDKAAGKGVIHKNNAARRKGRLMKKLASFVPAEPGAVKAKKTGRKTK